MVIYRQIIDIINRDHPKDTSGRGIHKYALELLENVNPNAKVPDSYDALKKQLLNGTRDWYEYSYGGRALVYDADIAKRMFTPSMCKKLMRVDGSYRNPPNYSNWLDFQAKMLAIASGTIWLVIKALGRGH
jgi:hypothetical protein